MPEMMKSTPVDIEKFKGLQEDSEVKMAVAAYLYQLGSHQITQEMVSEWYKKAIEGVRPTVAEKYSTIHTKPITQQTLFLASQDSWSKVLELVSASRVAEGVRVPKDDVCPLLLVGRSSR